MLQTKVSTSNFAKRPSQSIMLKFSIFVLSLLSVFVRGQQNCLGHCRVVCDDQHSSYNHLNGVLRGKQGVKGQKGEVGLPGPKGSSNNHLMKNIIENFGRLEKKVAEQSLLIEELSSLFFVNVFNSNYLLKCKKYLAHCLKHKMFSRVKFG